MTFADVLDPSTPIPEAGLKLATPFFDRTVWEWSKLSKDPVSAATNLLVLQTKRLVVEHDRTLARVVSTVRKQIVYEPVHRELPPVYERAVHHDETTTDIPAIAKGSIYDPLANAKIASEYAQSIPMGIGEWSWSVFTPEGSQRLYADSDQYEKAHPVRSRWNRVKRSLARAYRYVASL